MTMSVVRHLIQKGWEVSLAVLADVDGPKVIVPAGVVPLTLAGTRRIHPLAAILQLSTIIRRYDVILAAQEAAATNFSWAASRLVGRPTVSWTHTAFENFQQTMRPRDRKIAHAVYRRLDHVVFPSEGAAQSLARALGGRTAGEWHVIKNFSESRNEGVTPPVWREEWSAWFDRPVVLAVARLVAEKALDRLVRAHRNLLDRGLHHHLVIAGTGPERQALEAEAARLGVSATTFFAGHVEDPTPLYRRATVFGMCSRFEGFGLTLLEAMTVGLPVVAMDCESGPREVLDGGAAGVLTPDGDERAFADALARLLTDQSARRHYAAAGQLRAAEYTADRVMPQWEELLLRVAAEGRKHKSGRHPL